MVVSGSSSLSSEPYSSLSMAGVRLALGPSYTTLPWRSATARAIAQRHVDLVQRHHHGHLAAAVDLRQRVHHAARGFGIERGDRLVGQDDAGVLHQRARDGGALLLAAGQGRGALECIVVYTNLGKRVQAGADFVAPEPARQAAPQRHARQHAGQYVGDHRQAAHQIELLEHKADAGARASHLPAELAATLDQLAIDGDAARGRVARDETGQMAQQRRLAGTGRAQQGDHFAVGHLQTDIVQRLGAGMEGFAQALHVDGVIHRDPLMCSSMSAFCFGA